MGCDYYEKLYLRIENTNGDTRDIFLSETPHWFSGTYDSDSEDDYDRQLDLEMTKVEQRYGHKIIYVEGGWKITSKEKIEAYNYMVKEYLPKDSKIFRIYKYVDCIER